MWSIMSFVSWPSFSSDRFCTSVMVTVLGISCSFILFIFFWPFMFPSPSLNNSYSRLIAIATATLMSVLIFLDWPRSVLALISTAFASAVRVAYLGFCAVGDWACTSVNVLRAKGLVSVRTTGFGLDLAGATGTILLGDFTGDTLFPASFPTSHSPMLRLTFEVCVGDVEGPALSSAWLTTLRDVSIVFPAGVLCMYILSQYLSK